MTAERWETLARRVVLGTIAVTAGLLLLGMILSYSGLRAFYLGTGLPAWMASVYPLCVDLLALVGYVALLTLARKTYPGAVVTATVLGSAAAQGYHLRHGGIDAPVTDWRVLFLAGASAMICAGLAAHLLWRILERALPAGFITAMRADAPAFDVQPALQRPAAPPTEPARELDPLPPLPPPVQELEQTLADRPPLRSVPATVDGPQPPRTTARVHRPRREKATSQQPRPCWCTGDQTTGRAPCQGTVVKKSTWYRHNPAARREASDA